MIQQKPAAEGLADEEVVARVRAGETELYEILMRRYNQRLYRIARSITGSDSEAEDVMQEAYVRAYRHLDQFAGRARFSTWLTRIALYEAFARTRRRAMIEELDRDLEGGLSPAHLLAGAEPDPERQAASAELRRNLQAAVDSLAEKYRSVFVLREIEQLSTAETAQSLGLTTKTVKIRLHRARAFLRSQLEPATTPADLYPFHLDRCDRVVAGVFARLRQDPPHWASV